MGGVSEVNTAPPVPPSEIRAGAPPARPLAVAGLVAASWCVGIGLAVLTTITLVGWIAAPRAALGPGLPGVFRTAVNFWLVAHHAGFSLADGRVGLLPLGLTVLPGALLYRSGSWMIRAAQVARRSRVGVGHVAIALAVPYAVLAALLALAAGTPVVRPSAWQALLVCLLVATVAGGLGAARALVAARGRRVRSGLGALLRLLPDRPRSLLVGVLGALSVLVAAGALLVGVSLAMHLPEAAALSDELAPGVIGGILLLLIEVAFLPNAVIWGMAYAIGPGFAVGAGTSVSPTGVFLDVVPSFPPLAALPAPGPAPVLSLLSMAAPFLAGAVGGVLTIRTLPSPVSEGAPLWGFVCGALTGLVTAVLAALSGGPLGGGRLATMGPSAWQVGLMAALEVGISAAIAAWAANWLVLRRADEAELDTPDEPEPPAAARRPPATPAQPPAPAKPAAPAKRTPAHLPGPLEFEEAEPVLAPRRPARKVRPERREEAVPAEPPEEEAEPVPVPERAAEPEPDPAPDDPGRTERRGGAIYVLREDSADEI
jgi:uncharacterized protein DUF6350